MPKLCQRLRPLGMLLQSRRQHLLYCRPYKGLQKMQLPNNKQGHKWQKNILLHHRDDIMDNLQGNLSTILVWVYVIIAPYIATYMSQDQFVTIMTAIVGLIVTIWSAYNPNSFGFLGNAPEPMQTEETVMNDEYEC